MTRLCPTAERLLPSWTEADREAFYTGRLKVHGNQIRAYDEWRQRIRRERYIPAKLREQVLNWGTCRYCGGRAEVIDHYIPVTRGGYSVWANLIPACHLCNQGKADLFVDEWQARREKLGRPWPPPNTREIRGRLLVSVRAQLEPAIREGRMPPELSFEFMEVMWRFEKMLYDGADSWNAATAALSGHLTEQAGVDAEQRVQVDVQVDDAVAHRSERRLVVDDFGAGRFGAWPGRWGRFRARRFSVGRDVRRG